MNLGWGAGEWLELAAVTGWLALVIAMVWESTPHHCACCGKRVNRRHM